FQCVLVGYSCRTPRRLPAAPQRVAVYDRWRAELRLEAPAPRLQSCIAMHYPCTGAQEHAIATRIPGSKRHIPTHICLSLATPLGIVAGGRSNSVSNHFDGFAERRCPARIGHPEDGIAGRRSWIVIAPQIGEVDEASRNYIVLLYPFEDRTKVSSSSPFGF